MVLWKNKYEKNDKLQSQTKTKFYTAYIVYFSF